jgi:hypothetical protein
VTAVPWSRLYFISDSGSGLIAFQETRSAWAGVLAFSDQSRAEKFRSERALKETEIVGIDTSDTDSIAALIAKVKKRSVRCLMIDLDYKTGCYSQVEFVGDRLGDVSQRQLVHEAH